MKEKIILLVSILENDMLPFLEFFQNQNYHIITNSIFKQDVEELSKKCKGRMSSVEKNKDFSKLIQQYLIKDTINCFYTPLSYFFIQDWRDYAKSKDLEFFPFIVWRHPLEKCIVDSNSAPRNFEFI